MEKKRIKRVSKTAAVYIPIAILLIAFVMILGTSVFLSVIEISVSGASIYDDDVIIEASGIAPGNNILLLNKDGAKQNIFSAMPYVNEIVIELSLPDKVQIKISETEAFAAIMHAEGFLIVDSKCKILERAESIPEGMPEVRGFTPVDVRIGGPLRAAQGDDTRLRYIEEVLSAVEAAGIQDGVSYLDVTNLGFVNLGYMDLYTLVLSGSSGAAARLGKLPEALEDVKKDANFDETAKYRIDIPDSSGAWVWTPEW